MRLPTFFNTLLTAGLCLAVVPNLSADEVTAKESILQDLFQHDFEVYIEEEDGVQLLSMIAEWVIDEMDSTMPPEELVASFKNTLRYPGIRQQFLEIYVERFNEEDAVKVQELLQNDLYKTYGKSLEAVRQACTNKAMSLMLDLLQEVKTCETRSVDTHEVIEITQNNVQDILSAYPLLIIDVYADWCMPCKLFAPHFHDVSNELGDKYQFAKLDASAHQTIIGDFNITGLPTVLFLRDGKEVARRTGRLNKVEFVSAIQEAFEKK